MHCTFIYRCDDVVTKTSASQSKDLGSTTLPTQVKKMISDDWGWPDGRSPRDSCLAISAHFSDRGAETGPPHWGGETS